MHAIQQRPLPNFLILAPVAGVAFNQLKDGSIRVHINPHNAERFRLEVLRFADELGKYCIACVEQAKQLEQAKAVLPKTRIQQLEEELSRLKAEVAATPEPAGATVLQLPVPGMPITIPVAPAAIPFDEDRARAQTIVSGGFEPDTGDLPPPTGPTL